LPYPFQSPPVPGKRPDMGQVRVLIADDHTLFRTGLRLILEEVPDITVGAEASTSEEAVDLALGGGFNVVLLDISMPESGGLTALTEIKHAMPSLPVLMLTMYGEAHYAVRCLRAGASGYLTKDEAPEEIERAIRKAISGGKYVSERVAEELAVNIGQNLDAAHARLSNREFEVLRLLTEGMRITEISDILSLSPNTVSTYRSRILAKMGLNTTAELVQYALKNKLVT